MEGVSGTNYQLGMADPPWRYENNRIKHYPTMSLEQLKALPVGKVFARDSVMCMWATFPLLAEALELLKAWGFTYRTQLFTWIKTYPNGRPVIGLGKYTRQNAEVMLLGVKGKGLPRKRKNISSVLFSRQREHSRKPDEVRDLLVDLFGNNVRRIEFFARTRVAGWDAHGNETGKFSGNSAVATGATQSRMTQFLTASKDTDSDIEVVDEDGAVLVN